MGTAVSDQLPAGLKRDTVHNGNNLRQNRAVSPSILMHVAVEYRQHSFLATANEPMLCIVSPPLRGRFRKLRLTALAVSILLHPADHN